MADENKQQYVEVASNMYVGTKDGLKYALIQTSDSKFRLVEAVNDAEINLNASKISLSSPVTDESHKEAHGDKVKPTSGSKLIKLIALKSNPSPCKGQGDEIGNSVLSSPASISSFNESENAAEKISPDEITKDFDNSSKLTYTTLLPRQENREPLQNFDVQEVSYSTPRNVYYNYPTNFATPRTVRGRRGTRKSGMQFVPEGGAYCSPIPRTRGSNPRKRRPRQTSYQYNPQILQLTPSSESDVTSDFQMPYSASSSGSQFSASLSLNQSSIEYPRVPNNTPNSSEAIDASSNQEVFSVQWMPHISSEVENYISADPRETHNENERKRRLRIKNACHYMRSLLPGVTEKTDSATVFERAVSFINFIRSTVGNDHDIEFLEQMEAF